MEKTITHTYHVGGMTCSGCAKGVEKKLSAAPGVISVTIDLEKKQAEVTSTQAIKAETLQKSLNGSNYTIAELRA